MVRRSVLAAPTPAHHEIRVRQRDQVCGCAVPACAAAGCGGLHGGVTPSVKAHPASGKPLTRGHRWRPAQTPALRQSTQATHVSSDAIGQQDAVGCCSEQRFGWRRTHAMVLCGSNGCARPPPLPDHCGRAAKSPRHQPDALQRLQAPSSITKGVCKWLLGCWRCSTGANWWEVRRGCCCCFCCCGGGVSARAAAVTRS